MAISLFWIIFILFFGAVCGWFSGRNLAIYADWISHRFKVGPAFVGALLLAFVTSLPELTTTITTSSIGNAPLAVNNLLGVSTCRQSF